MARRPVVRRRPNVADRSVRAFRRQRRIGRSPVGGARTAALVLALSGCAATPPDETHRRIEQVLDLARARVEAGEDDQARQLLLAAEKVDPGDPGLALLRATLAPAGGAESVHDTPWLGSNRARRLRAERPAWARVLLYLPDRVLDLLDLASLDVHVGPGLFLDLHATRAVQAAAGARFVGGLGWHDQRSLGAQFQGESALNLPVVGTSATFAGRVGTSGIQLTRQAIFDLHRPSDPMYQEWRDYWAVGFAATVVLAGVDFDVHPVELADFLAGLATVDFLRDDFAASTSLGFTAAEERAVRALLDVEASSDALGAYREWVAARR